MDFPNLQSSPGRSSLFDHLAIVAVLAISLAVFHVSHDSYTGKGSVSDGVGCSLAFVVVAYYVGWLPTLWEIGRRRRFASLILPGLILCVLPYFYLTFRAFYIQPAATVIAFLIQLVALTYLSCRT
jgi:hypothetical protein